VKGVALNQTHSPERIERWRTADPFELGAQAKRSKALQVSFAEKTDTVKT